MTASTADYYAILGLTSDATLADVKKAYRALARQHHPDRNNADPVAIDRFRRITEAYEYLSAHLKDNAHGNGHSRPGPTAPPRADVGMPDGYSEAASRVVVIIIASRATGTLTRRILLVQTTSVTPPRGWYGEHRPRPWPFAMR